MWIDILNTTGFSFGVVSLSCLLIAMSIARTIRNTEETEYKKHLQSMKERAYQNNCKYYKDKYSVNKFWMTA